MMLQLRRLLFLLLVFAVSSLQGSVDISHLPVDTAMIRISSSAQNYSNVELWGQSTECLHCSLILLCSASGDTLPLVSPYVNLNFTPWDWKLEIRLSSVENTNEYRAIDTKTTFGEHGVYTIDVSEDVQIYPLKDVVPVNSYLPLIIAGCVLVGVAALWPLLLFGFRKVYYNSKRNRESRSSFEVSEDADGTKKKKKRVQSLDVFRGMCITIMIFVNYGGGGYWFFNHSLWNGLTVADLVFPWFIFIMGVAMPLSFQMLRQTTTQERILLKIIRRSVILFALGLFINDSSNILYIRILGVLQRFAIAYFVTGITLLYVPILGIKQVVLEDNYEETDNLLHNHVPPPKYKSSFFPFALHWAVAAALVGLWALLTFLLPVPGCPRGYLGPGGLSDNSLHFNCTGGAALYIDRVIFGEKHIFSNPTCKLMYHTGSYDPEGLLGNLTSIFLCFMGVLAGRILQVHSSPIKRIYHWLAWGIVFCALAALLCKMSQNDGWIPINKNLWSVSFVFLMGGGGFLVLTVMYLLVDVWKIWNGAPFIYVGMNSIIIYCGHETLGTYFPFNFYTATSFSHHSLLLTANLIGVSSWVLIAYMMFRNKFFVNI